MTTDPSHAVYMQKTDNISFICYRSSLLAESGVKSFYFRCKNAPSHGDSNSGAVLSSLN